MKLRNKKTGEIVEIKIYKTDKWGYRDDFSSIGGEDSLAELNEEWEDAPEEPKEDYIRVIESFIHYVEEADESFYCDESVKKFVEKLKAWKRLKDKGLKFKGISGYDEIHFWFPNPDDMFENSDTRKDLDLLFGDEE